MEDISFDKIMDDGIEALKLKKYNKSIELFSKAISIKPDGITVARAYNNRGMAYYLSRQYYKAIADLTKAIALNPTLSSIYNNRANVYSSLGEIDVAIEDYNRAIELDIKDEKLYYNRANAYSKKSNISKAIEDYSKSIDIFLINSSINLELENSSFYKFYPLNETLMRSIINKKLYFHSLKYFDSTVENLFFEEIAKNNQALMISLEDIKVFSLMKMDEGFIENAFMWNHYARSHTGLCVEYSFKREFFEDKNINFNKVSYRNFAIHNFYNLGSLIENSFFVRSGCWAYENEYRIITSNKNNYIHYPPSNILSVTFGLLSKDSEIEALSNLLKDTNNIAFFKMIQDKQKKINLKRVKLP